MFPGQIQIGRSSRRFTVLFDSGSTLSWIRLHGCSALLVKCFASLGVAELTPRVRRKFKIRYDDRGEVSGVMRRDWLEVSPAICKKYSCNISDRHLVYKILTNRS